MSNVIRIENWAVVWDQRLNGEVYGHPRFPEGKVVTTSPIVKYDKEQNTFRTQSGSVYQLGEPRAGYEEMFPDAAARMIKNGEEKLSNV